MQLGLGRMGLAPAAFWDYTLREFRMAAEGHHAAWNAGQRQEWERARWHAMVMLQPHMKKGRKLQAQDLALFPWERPAPGVKLTREQLRERIQNRDGWLG